MTFIFKWRISDWTICILLIIDVINLRRCYLLKAIGQFGLLLFDWILQTQVLLYHILILYWRSITVLLCNIEIFFWLLRSKWLYLLLTCDWSSFSLRWYIYFLLRKQNVCRYSISSGYRCISSRGLYFVRRNAWFTRNECGVLMSIIMFMYIISVICL